MVQSRLWISRSIMLLVITLALFSVYPVKSEQCMAPNDQQKSILRNIKEKLSDRSLNPHPMAFIALRMGIDHDLQMEQNILRRLSEMVVRKAEAGERFPIDLIASCILAFRSSCTNAAKVSAGKKEVNLVKMLRESLYREIHEESLIAASKENTRDSLKTFTEVSLAILVLCQEEEYVHRFFIYNFSRVHLRNIFQHAGKLTVDTMATTALTLRCLITSQQLRGRPRLEIAKALMRIIRWILSKVREDGTIGSLNSTGLAMQALAENINVYISRVYNCSKSVQKIVHEFSQGNFENLRTMSQVAIALGGKSLLDVNKIPCPVYKVTTMTTVHSTINGFPTRTASPSTLLINSSTLNQRIEPIPTPMNNPTIPPTSVHSMSMDTFSSLLRARLIPSSTVQPLNTTPSLMTSRLSTAMGSWTSATARIVNSATVPIMNSAAVPIVTSESVPIVTSGTAHIVNSEIVPIRTSEAAMIRETVPTVTSATAPIMTNRAVLTVTSETSPIMSSDVAPVATSRAANNASETAPVMTTETAHIISSETVPMRTSETAPILSSRTENIVYRETTSVMTSGTVFNVTNAPEPIVTNEAVSMATREANHRDQ